MPSSPAGISLCFARGFIPAQFPEWEQPRALLPAPCGGSNLLPSCDEHPVKPPTRPALVQTFYSVPPPSSGLALPFGGEAGRAPRPSFRWSSVPGVGRAAVAGTSQTAPSFTRGRKATTKSGPQNGHETPPPHPPNPVPQTQICWMGEGDTKQHKTGGDGDRSPLSHHATAPRELPAHGESPKTQGRESGVIS